MERTLIILKPDAVQRSLIGELLNRFERKGFKVLACKLIKMDQELASQHYAEHQGRDFFPRLLQFITSGPVFVMVLEGLQAISTCRKMMGSTNPYEADIGTIRYDYAQFRSYNLIHGSDSLESANREISLFFAPNEVLTYSKVTDSFIHQSVVDP